MVKDRSLQCLSLWHRALYSFSWWRRRIERCVFVSYVRVSCHHHQGIYVVVVVLISGSLHHPIMLTPGMHGGALCNHADVYTMMLLYCLSIVFSSACIYRTFWRHVVCVFSLTTEFELFLGDSVYFFVCGREYLRIIMLTRVIVFLKGEPEALVVLTPWRLCVGGNLVCRQNTHYKFSLLPPRVSILYRK